MNKYQQLMDFLPPSSNFRNDKSGTITSYRINQSQIENTERPALVFLHGFNGSSKSWACQFAHFTNHTVIAIDAPGFGESHSVEGGMVAIADEVAALTASLAIGKAVIIGHSMGGMLAQVLGATHPDRCQAIILSCTHKGRAQPVGSPLGAAVQERIQQREVMDDVSYGALRVGKMLSGEIDPQTMAFLAAVAGEIRVEGIRCGGFAVQYLDTSPILEKITAPVAIFTSADDVVVKPDATAALKAGLPQAHHWLLADVGHAPYCEDAASFNAAIEAFLDKVLAG
ncbi:alpha/beta hydrolase [Alphaproteobacteria bacterium]|nr:alpha/beta hydrolase [Alphaproteobacteria bacterium]